MTTAPPVDLLVSKSPRGQRRQEEIRLAASRLAYDDLPTFTLLQSVSSGLVETGDPMAYFGDLDEDCFHSLSMAQASSTTPFFEVYHGGVPDIAGHSSSLDVLHAVGGNSRTVVISDCAPGYIWVYPLAEVSQADFEAVVKVHYAAVENRRAWVPSSSLLNEIFISCPVPFLLPHEVCVSSPGRYGNALSAVVVLRSGLSRRQLVSQAGCVARLLATRAAGYLRRGQLTLSLFSPMLEAARFALNVRPRIGEMGPTVSRFRLWFARPPYLGSLLAMPGSVVRVKLSPRQITHGLYVCPLDGDAGQTAYCLDSRKLKASSHVMADVDPFLRLLTRTSSITPDLFDPTGLDYLIFGNIGSPSIFGDDIGLTSREWVAALVPPPPCEAVDLPGLVDVGSDVDTNAASSAVVDLKPSALALDRGPLLLWGATVPFASDSGAFLRVDTGAQLDLHAHTLPSAHAAVAA